MTWRTTSIPINIRQAIVWIGARSYCRGSFADYEDIRNHPKQMYGDVQPGDIKYKDVNGDGVVDDGDIVAIGATNRP